MGRGSCTSHLLSRRDIPQGNHAIITATQHMQLVVRKASHMDWRLVSLELPQQRAAAGIKNLRGWQAGDRAGAGTRVALPLRARQTQGW